MQKLIKKQNKKCDAKLRAFSGKVEKFFFHFALKQK